MLGARSNDRLFVPPKEYEYESSTKRHPYPQPKKPAIPPASSAASSTRAMFQTQRMKPIHQRASGAKSRPKKLSRYFANALLSGSGRRRRASVRNPARGVGLWEPLESTRPLGASQFKVALLPAMGRIMTELKTPLDERALDRLMLATDAAVVAYQEQRLKLEAARKARNNQQKADLAQTQIGGDNEIA
jgi:hypothetical protein